MEKLFVMLLTFGLPILSAVSASYFISAKGADSPAASEVECQSRLLEIGHTPKRWTPPKPGPDIKIVSYNIRWRSGDDLQRLAEFLKDDSEIGEALIIGLQEVDRNKKRTGKENTAEVLASALGMYYAWAAPPSPKTVKEEETGVAILSAYPLTDTRRLVLPHDGPGGRRRAALGATVRIGPTNVRVYSVHSENRIPIDCKLQQMKAVLNDLGRYDKQMPAIVMGDLNTWEPAAVAETFKLFAAAGFHTPFDDQPTFYRRALFIPIDLKLDWIWLRNLEATSNGIDRAIKLSDHFPLWLNVRRPGLPIDSTVTKQ